MKEESHNPFSDPQLEARIVALVLGEASDFERDQLNRLIEERPELATLKDQIQSVHGLLRDVGAGESLTDDDDWKLSADKRSAVLAVMGGDAEKQSAKQTLNKLAEKRRSAKGNSFLWTLTRIAAVICFVALPGSLAILAFFNGRSADSFWLRQLASTGADSRDSNHTSESLWQDDSAAPSADYLTDDAEVTAADEGFLRIVKPATVAEVDSRKNSKSVLSAIRESLDVDAIAEMPNDDEGPSVTISRDGDGLPAANWDLGFDSGKLGAQPSLRGFDAGAVSTEGVNGPVTWARPTADNPALSANGELSFPKFAGRPGELNAFDPSEPVRSTIRVPDEGTILLGGIQRFAERRSDPGVSGEPTDSSPMARDYAEPEGDLLDAVSEHGAISALDDQPVTGRESVDFGFATHDQTQKYKSERRWSEKDGSLATGEDESIDGLGAEGESLGGLGGGFGAAGMVPADGRRNEVSAEHNQGGISLRESGVLRDSRELLKTAPSQPMVARPSGGTDAAAAEEFFGTKISDRFRLANSIPGPTNEAPASKEDFKSKAIPAAADRYEEENGKESVTRPGDDDIGLSKNRTRDQIREMSETVTGIATARPRDGQEAGQAQQDIAGGLLSDDDNKNVDQIRERPPSELGGEQDGFRPRRGQAAIAGGSRWHWYVPPMLNDKSESMKKAPVKKLSAPAGLNEKTAESEAFSTFSLHVSDVSFKLARAALAQGQWPEAAKVRIEEFVNAFDYGDPMPSQNERVACCLEQSIHPFLQQRNLLRISMRTAAAGRSSSTPLRLTLLLDNSGSMERIDRQQTVRRAFALLAQQLKPIDQVTLISFARQPRLLADKVNGAQSHQLVQLIDNLPSEGGTNIEAALHLAFEKAREQQLDAAQNRIILLTDGAVNLGDADPESLSRMITTMRSAGIAFDAAGISAEGLNDEILEALTRKGDGRYYLLDSLEAADDGFSRQIAGALRPSAKNVKVQIEFNPKRVGRYKLLGFEKHRLKQEDFRNDKVDAAEMAAAEAGVAVYQFEAKPDGEGDVGSVSVRFRDLSTGQMIENRWPIPYEADSPRPDQAAPSLRIATSAALLAAKLRGEPLGETVNLRTLSDLIAGLPDRDRNAGRVQQLQLMIQQARQMSGE